MKKTKNKFKKYELDDEISAINIDYNHNNTLLEEENKIVSLRDKKMESAASLQKLIRYDKFS